MSEKVEKEVSLTHLTPAHSRLASSYKSQPPNKANLSWNPFGTGRVGDTLPWACSMIPRDCSVPKGGMESALGTARGPSDCRALPVGSGQGRAGQGRTGQGPLGHTAKTDRGTQAGAWLQGLVHRPRSKWASSQGALRQEADTSDLCFPNPV